MRISVSRMVKYCYDSCSCPGRMLDKRECTARWAEISLFGRTRWTRIVFLWFQKTRAGRTSATCCIESPMGIMLAILLCLAWITYVRARVDFVVYLQRIMNNSFYMFTNVRGAKARAAFWKGVALHPCNCLALLRWKCAALRRDPNFEKEPPSIPVTVGNF